MGPPSIARPGPARLGVWRAPARTHQDENAAGDLDDEVEDVVVAVAGLAIPPLTWAANSTWESVTDVRLSAPPLTAAAFLARAGRSFTDRLGLRVAFFAMGPPVQRLVSVREV